MVRVHRILSHPSDVTAERETCSCAHTERTFSWKLSKPAAQWPSPRSSSHPQSDGTQSQKHEVCCALQRVLTAACVQSVDDNTGILSESRHQVACNTVRLISYTLEIATLGITSATVLWILFVEPKQKSSGTTINYVLLHSNTNFTRGRHCVERSRGWPRAAEHECLKLRIPCLQYPRHV